jgi:hypothetical protein
MSLIERKQDVLGLTSDVRTDKVLERVCIYTVYENVLVSSTLIASSREGL